MCVNAWGVSDGCRAVSGLSVVASVVCPGLHNAAVGRVDQELHLPPIAVGLHQHLLAPHIVELRMVIPLLAQGATAGRGTVGGGDRWREHRRDQKKGRGQRCCHSRDLGLDQVDIWRFNAFFSS